MKGHWRTERRLRRERAEIPADLLDSLVRRTHSTAPRTTGVRIRFGAAAAVMAVASVTAAVFGGYSYAASAASKTSTFVSHIVSSPKPTRSALRSHGSSQVSLAGPAAVYTPHLTGVSCAQNGNHLNVTVSGSSSDSTPADAITATVAPSGATGSAAGAASWTIHINDPNKAQGTSVTVSQTNTAGSDSVTVSCT